MRNLVQPLQSVHCEHCGGELLFVRIELDDQFLEIEGQVFVCTKCRREYSRKLIHDPYTAHTLRGSGRMAQPDRTIEGFPAMAKHPSEQIAKAGAEALAGSGQAAEKIMKGSADAMGEFGSASRAAIQELTKAYQELATKNAKNLTDAMQALAAVKSPADFMELQQRLIKEGVEGAVSDSQHIAQLTTAVFTAAFEPVKKQIEALQKTAQS